MTRFAVGLALGLMVAPPVAQANTVQVQERSQPARAFKNLTFGAGPVAAPDLRQTPSPRVAPAPPQQQDARPRECMMRVIPPDPRFQSRMPVTPPNPNIDFSGQVVKVDPCVRRQ